MSDFTQTPLSSNSIPEMVWGIATHPNRFAVLAELTDPQEDTYAIPRSQIKKQRLQAEKALSSAGAAYDPAAPKGKANA
jgi:hypothetical protein